MGFQGKGPAIRPCTCSHDFQDRTYGKSMRLKNGTKKGYRCTVCSTEEVTDGK